VSKHIVEDGFKLGHDEHEQKGHDRHRHGHDDDWINHGGLYFVPNLGRLFLELSQTPKHELEDTAEFARFDHVHVKIVKNKGMLGEGIGKRAAALHGVSKLV